MSLTFLEIIIGVCKGNERFTIEVVQSMNYFESSQTVQLVGAVDGDSFGHNFIASPAHYTEGLLCTFPPLKYLIAG